MSIRSDIAAAASTVDGVTCASNHRQLTRLGDACVRFVSNARDDSGFGFLTTWQVWIALHQDIATAEKWIDDHTDALIAALSPEMTVTTIAPAELNFGTNSIPGVIVEGIRGKEN